MEIIDSKQTQDRKRKKKKIRKVSNTFAKQPDLTLKEIDIKDLKKETKSTKLNQLKKSVPADMEFKK